MKYKLFLENKEITLLKMNSNAGIMYNGLSLLTLLCLILVPRCSAVFFELMRNCPTILNYAIGCSTVYLLFLMFSLYIKIINLEENKIRQIISFFGLLLCCIAEFAMLVWYLYIYEEPIDQLD